MHCVKMHASFGVQGENFNYCGIARSRPICDSRAFVYLNYPSVAFCI